MKLHREVYSFVADIRNFEGASRILVAGLHSLGCRKSLRSFDQRGQAGVAEHYLLRDLMLCLHKCRGRRSSEVIDKSELGKKKGTYRSVSQGQGYLVLK